MGVRDLPAIIGRTVNGEQLLLGAGIATKDLKSGVKDLKSLLESFEKKSKKATYQAKRSSETEPEGANVPLLTPSNFDDICGDKTSLCIIGAYRSSKAKEKLEKILTAVSIF